MPALVIWLIRIVGMAYVARRAMRSARQTHGGTPLRGRRGALDIPDYSVETRAVLRETRDALRAIFWSLAAREVLVLGVAAAIVGAAVLILAR